MAVAVESAEVASSPSQKSREFRSSRSRRLAVDAAVFNLSDTPLSWQPECDSGKAFVSIYCEM